MTRQVFQTWPTASLMILWYFQHTFFWKHTLFIFIIDYSPALNIIYQRRQMQVSPALIQPGCSVGVRNEAEHSHGCRADNVVWAGQSLHSLLVSSLFGWSYVWSWLSALQSPQRWDHIWAAWVGKLCAPVHKMLYLVVIQPPSSLIDTAYMRSLLPPAWHTAREARISAWTTGVL